MNENIVVQNSPISGRGVFATKAFAIREIICRFEGQPSSVADLRSMYLGGRADLSCDALQIGDRDYLMLDSPYVYMNHSCSPNAGFRGPAELIAAKPIAIGEEIFFDYSTTEWTPQDYVEYDQSEWPMPCSCNVSGCRKLITCFPYIPASRQKEYFEKEIVPEFIRKKIMLPPADQRCPVCEARMAAKKNASTPD